MNILILTHSFPDTKHNWRGIFIQEQAKALSAYFNVTVVYFKVDYSHFAPFSKYAFTRNTSNNFELYEVTINKSFPVITQLKYLSNTYNFLNKEIFARTLPDVIHSHLSYPAGFLGSIIQKSKKIPNVLTEHSRIDNYFRSWLHKKCVSYAFRESKVIIAVSSSLKNEIVSFSHRSVTVIPNIVDVGIFELKKTKPGKFINIGFLGGMNNNNKGLDLLLQSVSRLGRKDFFLHIGGTGKLLGDFKEMTRALGLDNNCKFYEEITRNDISDYYSKLDFLVLPSRYETFGIVLIEAMACGIPVIATKCGGPVDIVTPETGLLIEKDNIDELKNAILTMSETLELYNKLTIRNYAKSSFGQEIFIKRQSELYQKILTAKSNE